MRNDRRVASLFTQPVDEDLSILFEYNFPARFFQPIRFRVGLPFASPGEFSRSTVVVPLPSRFFFILSDRCDDQGLPDNEGFDPEKTLRTDSCWFTRSVLAGQYLSRCGSFVSFTMKLHSRHRYSANKGKIKHTMTKRVRSREKSKTAVVCYRVAVFRRLPQNKN